LETGEAAASVPGFDHSYARLGELFSTPQKLDPVSNPTLIFWNQRLAEHLGWPGDPISDPQQLGGLAGNELLSHSQPIATVYAGHQFGQYNPQLGDGRATLLVARHFANSNNLAITGGDPKPAITLLEGVCHHFARLVAQWQVLGFVHGVLNTDNALLCGETIDFGPCAFMDHFDPQASFSSIDRQGRYAWHNQPGIMHWNLAVLAECLLPLIDDSEETARHIAQTVVDRYPEIFHAHHQNWLAAKLGLDAIRETDTTLVQAFHDTLAAEQLDFTLAFRWLAECANSTVEHSPLPELFTAPESLQDWAEQWKERRRHNTGDQSFITANMHDVNPAIIPRNHLVQHAIDTVESGSLEWAQRFVDRVASPYEWQAGDDDWARVPSEAERVTRTYCGT
jgi:uncharacterized protein YdiU (UPF0061 family)